VFHIIQEDGPDINMLKEPGKLTELILKIWIEDLTDRGVWDPINRARLPLCPYDEQNLIWSGDAFEASCTPSAKQSLHFEIKDSEINGPLALFVYLFKAQRPSRAKVDALADTVKAVKLASIPGENVSGFMETVIPLLEDIEMAAMTFSQVPNLTSLAMTGLMSATDTMISSEAKTIFCDEDGDGSAASDVSTLSKAQDALTLMENKYLSLVQIGHYGPAMLPIKPGFQANLAGVPATEQLSQDRGANSTTGNRPAKAAARCWDCDQVRHFKGDPKCPGPKTGAKTGATPSAHGLSDADSLVVSGEIQTEKAKFPAGTEIPDGHEIKRNGEVVAIWCSKCKRFLKGKSMHTAATHGKKSDGNGAAAPARAPPPAPATSAAAAANVASLESQLALANVAAGMYCGAVTVPPVAKSPKIPTHLLAANPPNYQLGRPAGYLGAVTHLGAVTQTITEMPPIVPGVLHKGATMSFHKRDTRETTDCDDAVISAPKRVFHNPCPRRTIDPKSCHGVVKCPPHPDPRHHCSVDPNVTIIDEDTWDFPPGCDDDQIPDSGCNETITDTLLDFIPGTEFLEELPTVGSDVSGQDDVLAALFGDNRNFNLNF
jgi:hypothetical protein